MVTEVAAAQDAFSSRTGRFYDEDFALRETRVAPNGLISARVELLPEEDGAEMDPACQQVLKLIIDRTNAANFPSPLRLDDPKWVSYRLSETLPLPLAVRQELLESDTATRFQRLRDMLARQGVLTDREI